MNTLGAGIATLFTLLGLWHLYWSLGGRAFLAAAIPSIDGRQAFVPGRAMTAVVGGVLLLCALLVGLLNGATPRTQAATALSGFGYALAAGLLLRAIGDFRLVGFFKQVRDSRFARMDSLLYSPGCLLLAVGICALSYHHSTWRP